MVRPFHSIITVTTTTVTIAIIMIIIIIIKHLIRFIAKTNIVSDIQISNGYKQWTHNEVVWF